MTYAVYGIRIIGSTEPRYIGQTGNGVDTRLAGHYLWCRQMPLKSPFAAWLLGNEGNIEAFVIDYHESRADALASERTAIEVCAKLGHRLFNVHHVPRAILKSRRTERPTDTTSAAAEKAA